MEAEDPPTERRALVDSEASPPEDPPAPRSALADQEAPWRPRLAPRWLRRLAGGAALIMVVMVGFSLDSTFQIGSLRFLEGVAPRAWQALQAELGASKELPTVGLAQRSPEAGKVLCVVDVAQATGWIMTLGSFLKFTETVCDFDRIARVQKRKIRNDERETCATGIFGIFLSLELGLGVTSSSVSTCSGSLNIPANCAANIGAFTGGISVLMQASLSADLICHKGIYRNKNTPEEKKDAFISTKEGKITAAKEKAARSVRKWLKNQGVNVATLPPPAAISTAAVYGAINRCVAQVLFGSTFAMRLGIILADSTIHCTPQAVKTEGRVCAIDISGIIATLSLTIRFFALVSNSCINIVGRSDRDANCVAAVTGITGSTTAALAASMNLEAACHKALALWDPDKWPQQLPSPVVAPGHEREREGKVLDVPVEDGNVLLPDP